MEGGRDTPPVAVLYSAIWLPFLPAVLLAPLVGQQSRRHFPQCLDAEDTFIHVTYVCWCLKYPTILVDVCMCVFVCVCVCVCMSVCVCLCARVDTS